MYYLGAGEGVPRDNAEAMKWWRKAADQGNAQAQAVLGLLYYHGEGVPSNYAEAIKWWRKAADQGNAGAQANLGFMYYHGEGVPRDNAQAMKWWRKVADQGNAGAQANLASVNKPTADDLVQHCVDVVHHHSDATGFFAKFDAFYNPANGTVENNARLVGDEEPLYQFNKCMASQGQPLTYTTK
jgi:hypothetical protein